LAAAQVAGHRWLNSAEDWEAERWEHPDAHGGATGGAALATPDAGSEAAREVVGLPVVLALGGRVALTEAEVVAAIADAVGPLGRRRYTGHQLLANLNLTTAATKLGPELGASPRSLLGLSADGYYSLPELLPPTGAAATALAHRRTHERAELGLDPTSSEIAISIPRAMALRCCFAYEPCLALPAFLPAAYE
jgi:hypothetical protein